MHGSIIFRMVTNIGCLVYLCKVEKVALSKRSRQPLGFVHFSARAVSLNLSTSILPRTICVM
jgi:hypothetical protein